MHANIAKYDYRDVGVVDISAVDIYSEVESARQCFYVRLINNVGSK
jgi:hypothetical protein